MSAARYPFDTNAKFAEGSQRVHANPMLRVVRIFNGVGDETELGSVDGVPYRVSFSVLALVLVAAPVQLHDTDVLFDVALVPNTQTTVFVSVSASSSIDRQTPVDGARVEVRLGDALVGENTTGADGSAVVAFRVPDDITGSQRMEIRTTSALGTDRIARVVQVRPSTVMSLRTDRTVYQPGDTLSYVVALVRHANATPLAKVPVEVTIVDPAKTKIWSGTVTTSNGGFGTGRLPLSKDLRRGTYTLQATARGHTKTAQIDVHEVELPSFFVHIDADAKQVTARYPYGEPVVGTIVVMADGAAIGEGRLDSFGRFSFPTPATGATLRAVVKDGADRTEEATHHVARPTDRIEAVFVPERPRLTPGRKQYVTLITTDGDGNLLPASVRLAGSDVTFHGSQALQSPGAVRFLVTPSRGAKVTAEIVGPMGKVLRIEKSLHMESGRGWIRAREVVIDDGRPIEFFGGFSGAKGPIVVSLMRDDVPVASTFVRPNENGGFQGTVDAPDGVFGLVTVRAAEVKAKGRFAASTIYLAPTPLGVALEGTPRHRPGTTATVVASVTDRTGAPAKGVGLFSSVVDERALALSKHQPTLVELLTTLDVDTAKILGIRFAKLLGRGGRGEVLARRAIVESLPSKTVRPQVQRDAQLRHAAEAQRANEIHNLIVNTIATAKVSLGHHDAAEGWTKVNSPATILRRAGWSSAATKTPWQRDISWRYLRHFGKARFSLDAIARQAQRARMARLHEHLLSVGDHGRGQGLLGVLRGSKMGSGMASDVWGSPMQLGSGQLRSAGADRVFGNGDDVVVHNPFSAGSGGLGLRGTGMGGGGYGSAVGGLGVIGTMGYGGGTAAPAIRAKFDETVLWAATLVTDEDGRATVRIPFSDSVTGWQLGVDALGPTGAVGRGQMRLETFLPLSVDASVPRVLTTDDRYTVRAVATNHTAVEQTLDVAAVASGALSGERRQRVVLPAGAATAVAFEVTATKAGEGTITLTLSSDGRAHDVVERRITVEAPGRMRYRLMTSVVTSNAHRIKFELPDTPAEESFEGSIRLYRNPADQALDGVEGLLREPHGCFEQTSSATYPNLMVLQLLKDDPNAETIRSRAHAMVGRGYQRLISYEVSGGGFSWFGQAPAHRALTAYGLMEFNDMAKVYPVDASLIQRTTQWLLAQQASDGSWAPDDHALHDWSAVSGRISATAYIAWALAESGYRGAPLDRALRYLGGVSKELEANPYLLSLWVGAESVVNPQRAAPILRTLRGQGAAESDGLKFSARGQTLFFAKGAAADAQVTALAAAALVRLQQPKDAHAALRWLWAARTPQYGWGTPQGTVLALRAAVMSAHKSTTAPQSLVSLDGRPLGELALDGADVPTIALPTLGLGQHEIGVATADGLLADVRYRWRSQDAPAAIDAGIQVTLDVPKDPVPFGTTGQFHLVIANPGDADVIMPTAVIPIAPGFKPKVAHLEALRTSGLIDRYEDVGSAINLYLTKLAAHAKVEMDIGFVAEAQCDVTQRAARVYAYYSPETMGESATHRIRGSAL